jgi:hypothetical protein
LGKKEKMDQEMSSDSPTSDIDIDEGDDEAMMHVMASQYFGGFHSDSDEDSEICMGIGNRLLNCLESVNFAGSFAAHVNDSAYVNPGLEIVNYGTMPLPLRRKDVEDVIKLCKRAPFGKKEKTIVDTNVRRTWELDANEFGCNNPAWPAYLKELMNKAVSELGAEGEIEAQPYKLLIYEEGAFFKAHRDTEKVPGMFGTLVISLPSQHEGGEVHLSHAGREVIFQTSESSTYDLCALSWYSDVKHEIKPITSGHRVVLTYNLVTHATTSDYRPSADLLETDRKALTKCLQHWINNHPADDRYIHVLMHQYTQSSLGLSSLKGNDALIVRYLQQVCSANEIYVFLASMTRTVQMDEEFGDEEFDDEILLSNIISLKGVTLFSRLRVEQRELTEDHHYFEREPDSEDEAEYTGNEGMISASRYHDSVILLVPKIYFYDVFLQESNSSLAFFHVNVQETLEFLLSDLIEHPESTILKTQAKKSLSWALDGVITSNPFLEHQTKTEGMMKAALKLCDILDEPDELARAITKILTFTNSSVSLIKIAIEKIMPSLDEHSTKAKSKAFWDQHLGGLTQAGKRLLEFPRYLSHLKSIEIQLPAKHQAQFRDWQTETTNSLIATALCENSADIEAAIIIIKDFEASFFLQK